MPTHRPKSRRTGIQQKFHMTPADNAQSMVEVLDVVYNSALERRWEIVYESASGVLSTTQGDPEVSAAGESFTDYMGDTWIAFGTVGFTPIKFYKIEAIHSDTAMRLEHFVTSATASGLYYVIARPIRYTVEFEPGNYDFENYPNHDCDNAACLSLVGISTDAQIMFNSAENLQGIIRQQGGSGELAVKRLGLYCTHAINDTFKGQQPFRFQATDTDITNFICERNYLQTPNTDFFAAAGAGTVIFRNNHGIVGYDGLGGIVAPDKVFAYGNSVRASTTYAHGKSGIGVIANAKAGTFGPREVWVHGNNFEIEDDGSITTATIGVSIKHSAVYTPGNSPSYISSHNRIHIISEQTGVETNSGNFAAGIYSWTEGAGPYTDPDVHSHGDIITLSGGATNMYGYKAHTSKISIWNRPDAHAVNKASGGTIDDDGVPIP